MAEDRSSVYGALRRIAVWTRACFFLGLSCGITDLFERWIHRDGYSRQQGFKGVCVVA